jgi:hypothetical protein
MVKLHLNHLCLLLFHHIHLLHQFCQTCSARLVCHLSHLFVRAGFIFLNEFVVLLLRFSLAIFNNAKHHSYLGIHAFMWTVHSVILRTLQQLFFGLQLFMAIMTICTPLLIALDTNSHTSNSHIYFLVWHKSVMTFLCTNSTKFSIDSSPFPCLDAILKRYFLLSPL